MGFKEFKKVSREINDEVKNAAEDVSDSADLDGNGTMDYRVYWDCK